MHVPRSTDSPAPGSSAGSGAPEHALWRADFPALDQTVNGFPLAYLDSAATTQRPAAVLTALQDYYRHDNANPGKALHALARRAFDRYEGVTEAVRASCYLYTETSELDRLADALDQLLASQA